MLEDSIWTGPHPEIFQWQMQDQFSSGRCRKPVFAPCDDAVRWQMPTNQEDMPHSELIGTEISQAEIFTLGNQGNYSVGCHSLCCTW